MRRRKNPHPKRAVTARTVLKAPAASLDAREEEEEVEEEEAVSYTHLRAHETEADLVCRLLLEKKKGRNF